MAEIASAYVSLLPSAKGWGSSVAAEINPELEKAGKSGGGRISSAIGGVLKKSAIGIGVAAGGVLSTALFKGWGRLTQIENAKASLAGLGHSTETVQTIMDNALAAVKGTAFGLDEAASIAASAVAAGVKPGKDLRRTLGLVADTATISGRSIGDMGAIWNKVATSNKVQGDVINQLNDAGIPIVQLLGKSMGKTTDQVLELSRQGKIGFAEFSDAMETGLGGAALKSGDTTVGSFKNMGAALSRFGVALLQGVFPLAKQVFGGITDLLDKASAKVTPFVDAFSEKLGPAVRKFAGGAIKALPGLVSDLWGRIQPLVGAVKDFVRTAVDAGKRAAPAIGSIVKALAPLAGAVIVGGLTSAFKALRPVVAAAGKVLGVIGDFAKNHTTIFRAFVATIVAGVVAFKAWKLGVAAAEAITKAWAAAQGILNAVMSANPIMIAVIAIAALVAGLVVAYNSSETFRNIVQGAFNAVQTVISGVFNWVKNNWPLLLGILTGPIGLAVLAIVKNWDTISAAFTAVKDWISARVGDIVGFITGIPGRISRFASSAFDSLKGAASAVKDWVAARFDDLVSTITGLPDRISRVAGGMFDGIKNAFRSALNWVIDAWNGLEFKIPGFDPPGPGPKFGGFTLGVPNIPRMHTGGIFNPGRGEGLAVLKRGEGVFTPEQMRAMGGQTFNGPVTIISGATSARDVFDETMWRQAG